MSLISGTMSRRLGHGRRLVIPRKECLQLQLLRVRLLHHHRLLLLGRLAAEHVRLALLLMHRCLCPLHRGLEPRLPLHALLLDLLLAQLLAPLLLARLLHHLHKVVRHRRHHAQVLLHLVLDVGQHGEDADRVVELKANRRVDAAHAVHHLLVGADAAVLALVVATPRLGGTPLQLRHPAALRGELQVQVALLLLQLGDAAVQPERRRRRPRLHLLQQLLRLLDVLDEEQVLTLQLPVPLQQLLRVLEEDLRDVVLLVLLLLRRPRRLLQRLGLLQCHPRVLYLLLRPLRRLLRLRVGEVALRLLQAQRRALLRLADFLHLRLPVLDAALAAQAALLLLRVEKLLRGQPVDERLVAPALLQLLLELAQLAAHCLDLQVQVLDLLDLVDLGFGFGVGTLHGLLHLDVILL
mmetsp:Transcript_39247/g.100280  ORF Transcript_39247/g.100280 Transcript_39247/m.100280 type:complete len:409 (-) Transcript_39247:1193-2419(-)